MLNWFSSGQGYLMFNIFLIGTGLVKKPLDLYFWLHFEQDIEKSSSRLILQHQLWHSSIWLFLPKKRLNVRKFCQSIDSLPLLSPCPSKTMLLGLFKNATRCMSDPSNILHFLTVRYECNHILRESKQHSSKTILKERKTNLL